ncbi:telomere zinc finger-associated protein-like isoform X2 [Argopecten irradians]
MEEISNHNQVLPVNQNESFLAVQNAVLPNSPDFEMETICPDLEHEIDPTLLDDIDLYLECDDDDVNFTAPVPKDYKNITFKVSFYPGSQTCEGIPRKTFTCQICKDIFQMETKFRVHMDIHHGDQKPFTCGICSYRAASVKLQKQHLLKVHKTKIKSSEENLESLTDISGPNIKFICSKCPFSTLQKDNLEEHFNEIHSKVEKTFSCDQCNYVCKQKKTFSLHVKKHGGISSELVCEICGKDFLTKPQFNRHYKTHREGRPFKCTVPGCKSTFKIQGALTDHIKTVHTSQK